MNIECLEVQQLAWAALYSLTEWLATNIWIFQKVPNYLQIVVVDPHHWQSLYL